MPSFDVIIYHNPQCSTSRNVMNSIKILGFEPHVIEYLKTPPSARMLLLLAVRAGVNIKNFIRTKEPSYFALIKSATGDEEIAEILNKHPELIERPIVISPVGVRLCRPAELVNELLIVEKQD